MTRVTVNQGHPTFLLLRSTPVIVGCWFMCRTWKNIKRCGSPAGLCPRVGDPCCKQNCTLNWSLGTLQLSCSFCSCVITCAVRMCHGAASESKKFPPVPVSISISVIQNSGGTFSEHCAM